MATIHGVAGEWARVKGTVTGLWPLFLGVFAAGFSLALAIFVWHGAGAVVFVLSLVAIAWSMVRGMRHVERFYKGARGEERVAAILRNLPEGYHVFNDFVAGRLHIDHVVVGPAGVFAIETKFWRGIVTVEDEHVLADGRLPSRDPLVQVLREAAALRETLAGMGWKGGITPVLTFASNTFAQHSAEVKGVVVINASELGHAFAASRTVMPSSERDRLVQLMN